LIISLRFEGVEELQLADLGMVVQAARQRQNPDAALASSGDWIEGLEAPLEDESKANLRFSFDVVNRAALYERGKCHHSIAHTSDTIESLKHLLTDKMSKFRMQGREYNLFNLCTQKQEKNTCKTYYMYIVLYCFFFVFGF
jgi:hypothetical protein